MKSHWNNELYGSIISIAACVLFVMSTATGDLFGALTSSIILVMGTVMMCRRRS